MLSSVFLFNLGISPYGYIHNSRSISLIWWKQGARCEQKWVVLYVLPLISFMQVKLKIRRETKSHWEKNQMKMECTRSAMPHMTAPDRRSNLPTEQQWTSICREWYWRGSIWDRLLQPYMQIRLQIEPHQYRCLFAAIALFPPIPVKLVHRQKPNAKSQGLNFHH